MKAIKRKTILGILMISFCLAGAITLTAHTPFIKTMACSWLAVEAVALLVTEFGAKRTALAAGMLMGANVYVDTALLDAQAFIKADPLKRFQLRKELTEALPIFEKDREFTIPNLASIRSSTTRATTALYLKNKDFTEIGSKSCDPSGETSGSSSVPINWAKKTYAMSFNEKQFDGNQVSIDQARAIDLWNLEKTLWKDVDQAAIDYLETNRSAINNGESGSFDTVNDIMAINASDADEFYNLVGADMQINNYNPMYSDLFNTMWGANKNFIFAQGAGNDTNLEFQNVGFNYYRSNLISGNVTIGNNTYTSIHYVVPDQAVAVLDWNESLNVRTKQSADKFWFTMDSSMRPGYKFDVFKKTGCGDTTSSGGAPQDYTEVWEITIWYAFAKQPLSGVNETGIFKYGILDGDSFSS